jgi:predicted RNase H-like nuclease
VRVGVRVLGVDGCRDGWVGVVPEADGPRAYAAGDLPTLLALVDADGPVERVGIDIPIGLAETGWRDADTLAASLLGRRRASIFRTPVRAALTAPDHAAGVAISRARSDAGFSVQAWGLRTKILEVDAVVQAGEARLFEVHPEVSFTALGGRSAAYAKKTWAGQRERLALLAAAGIDLTLLVGDVGLAAPDDVVDAAACAWTAARLARGTASSLPDPPQELPDGRAAAIWT